MREVHMKDKTIKLTLLTEPVSFVDRIWTIFNIFEEKEVNMAVTLQEQKES